MSENLKKSIEKLKFIASIKDVNKRKKLLDLLSDSCLYHALNEIALNTVEGKIKLNSTQRKKLYKHKNAIKRVSKKTVNKRKRHLLVKQSGGFLPILLPAIASIITSLINK